MHVHSASRDHTSESHRPLEGGRAAPPRDRPATAGRPCEMFITGTGTARRRCVPHHRTRAEPRESSATIADAIHREAPSAQNRKRSSKHASSTKRYLNAEMQRASAVPDRSDTAEEIGRVRSRPRHADSAVATNPVRPGTPRAWGGQRNRARATLGSAPPRRQPRSGSERNRLPQRCPICRGAEATQRADSSERDREVEHHAAARRSNVERRHAASRQWSADPTMRAAHRSGSVRTDHRRHATRR